MKKIFMIPAILLSILFVSSCELIGEDTYDNAYAQIWYRVTENAAAQNWDILKMDLSDQSFEASESILYISGERTDFTGTTKGSITEVNSNTLILTVDEKYINGDWYSKEGYIEYLVSLEVSQTQAEITADGIFVSETVNYAMSTTPETLTFTSVSSDFAGTYYTEYMIYFLNN